MLRREIIKSGEHNIHQPVNLKRLLWNAQRVFDKEQGGKTQSSKLDAACWLLPITLELHACRCICQKYMHHLACFSHTCDEQGFLSIP